VLRRGGGKFFRFVLLAALTAIMPQIVAAQAASYETIYSFKGSPDGGDPKAGLVIGKNGALYGTTYGGGASVLGTVFEMTKSAGEPWKETVLYSFSGSDGQYPESALVFGSTGTLYGVTVGGGGGGSTGVIFALAPPSAAGGTWTETVLYAFGFSSENAAPNGPLLIGPGGTLYTTTQGSGGPTARWPPCCPQQRRGPSGRSRRYILLEARLGEGGHLRAWYRKVDHCSGPRSTEATSFVAAASPTN
jgi:hypothetical protein